MHSTDVAEALPSPLVVFLSPYAVGVLCGSEEGGAWSIGGAEELVPEEPEKNVEEDEGYNSDASEVVGDPVGEMDGRESDSEDDRHHRAYLLCGPRLHQCAAG